MKIKKAFTITSNQKNLSLPFSGSKSFKKRSITNGIGIILCVLHVDISNMMSRQVSPYRRI